MRPRPAPDPSSVPAGIVTPEAVLLDFDTAGVGSRGIALALDLAVQLTALVTLLTATGFFLAGVDAAAWVGVSLVTVLAFAMIFGYPVALETLWGGRTLGKAAVGLRVVTREGTPVRFRHAAVRGALLLVDLWFLLGLVGAVAILLSRRDQRLGDMAAGTLVLRERRAEPEARAVWFPPPYGLEAYTATLDVSTLDATDARLVRSFLLRAPSLAPGARGHLAGVIAGRVAGRLRHVPPPGLPAEAFLACVAAAAQARSGVPPTASGPSAPAMPSAVQGPPSAPPAPERRAPPPPPPGAFAPPG